MAVVTTTRNIYATVPYKTVQKQSGCSGCYDQWKVTKVGYDITGDYTTEQRVRPESVWDSFTSRPLIKVVKDRYAREWSPQVPCSGCTLRNWAYTSKVLQYVQEGWGDPPETDWALKAREAIEERQQNIAESLYEWKQTAGMVVTASKILRSGWRLYKGRAPKARQRLSPCDVAGAELAFSFGVNPLIMETQEAYERLVTRVEGGLVQQFKVTGFGRKPPTVISTTLFNGEYYWKRKQYASFLVQYANIVPSFTFGAPWELAWEITPFSWLIDGFVDIGSYLNSLDALKGVARIKGTLTTKDQLTAIGNNRKYTTSTCETPERYSERRYQRDVITTIPLPPRPKFNPTRSWRKLMHATSALITLNKGCTGRKNPFIL